MRAQSKKFLFELTFISSIVGFIGVLVILGAALVMQYWYGEQPCPLCLLQRAGFVSIGLALLANVKYGNKVAHWALIILSACAGIAVSIRQILLHITDPVGFGSVVWGLHMYTWCFIGFAVAIVASAMVLLVYPGQTS